MKNLTMNYERINYEPYLSTILMRRDLQKSSNDKQITIALID